MKIRGAVLGAFMIALCAGSTAAAAADPDSRDEFAPVKKLVGSTGDELLAEWFAQVLAIPAAQSPYNPPNPGRCLTLGRDEKVVSLLVSAQAAPLSCTIKPGTPLFLPASSNVCSSALPEPNRAVTEEAQRQCATQLFSFPGIVAIYLSLDGGPPIDVHAERFELVSPQTSVNFPQDAVFGAQAGPATFVGASYAVTTQARLRPGPHTITVKYLLADETSISVTFMLNVVPGYRG